MNKLIGLGIIVILVVAGIGIYLYTDNPFIEEPEKEYWTWELVEGWNDNVVFTQEQIDDAGGTAIEVVFASIMDEISYVFSYENMDWGSWVKGEPHNSLEIVTANAVYRVYVTEDCTLEIEK